MYVTLLCKYPESYIPFLQEFIVLIYIGTQCYGCLSVLTVRLHLAVCNNVHILVVANRKTKNIICPQVPEIFAQRHGLAIPLV